GDAQDVRPRGNLVFVADGSAGLAIVDVSSPSAPILKSTLGGLGFVQGVDISGNFALLAADSNLRVVDVSNPSAAVAIGVCAPPIGRAVDVVANGSFAYVANYTGSLQVVDFSNPRSPVAVGSTTGTLGGYLLDVARYGNLIFGADVFFVNGVPIIDVTTPTA